MLREDVNVWSNEGLEELMKGSMPGSAPDDDDNRCDKKWENMKEDITLHANGMYDEMGFFPCLCRHSFVLMVADMVKSGKLAKYGFAIAAHLLKVLGEIATSYNIGCKFGKMEWDWRTSKNANAFSPSPTASLLALNIPVPFIASKQSQHTSNIQIQSTLTKGDLTIPVPAMVLANKYRRALKIKATLPMLREAMESLGMELHSVFKTWLEKEKAYLDALRKEPEQETLQIEYYQKLVNLQDQESHLAEIQATRVSFVQVDLGASYGAAAGQTQRTKTQWTETQQMETQQTETQRRWHAIEVASKTLSAMQDLEVCLRITRRWEAGDMDWTATAIMVTNHRRLLTTVIAGYKLRKHIAKALQACSKGADLKPFGNMTPNSRGSVSATLFWFEDANGWDFPSVLDSISTAGAPRTAKNPSKPSFGAHLTAVMLFPARMPPSWEQIVDYAFLADFDLLREVREDIRSEPWAQPAECLAMDQHHKLLRADEEIARLNLEIPCHITYMVDEERFLIHHEGWLQAEGNWALEHQVRVQRVDRSRLNSVHMERLTKLSKEEGFMASLSPGVSIAKEHQVPEAIPSGSEDVEMQEPPQYAGDEGDDEDTDADADVNGKAIANAFEAIYRLYHVHNLLYIGQTSAAPPSEILMGMMAGGARAISDGNCCGCCVINAWCGPKPKPVKLEGETHQISPSILTGYVGVTGMYRAWNVWGGTKAPTVFILKRLKTLQTLVNSKKNGKKTVQTESSRVADGANGEALSAVHQSVLAGQQLLTGPASLTHLWHGGRYSVSESVERLFSKSQHLCRETRSTLHADAIMKAMLTKIWIKAGIKTNYMYTSSAQNIPCTVSAYRGSTTTVLKRIVLKLTLHTGTWITQGKQLKKSGFLAAISVGCSAPNQDLERSVICKWYAYIRGNESLEGSLPPI
ncbi:hypothetical protein DFH08DRAFT_799747 [Mycena albidolilacea]|uniref:Uncharacterized protein n=1 Tax=Mycena albidolilacea TaxID=1033008 RepID=A0AAD7F2C6_9AGAR|nr:hypothetical protein DFH08DRAFT_799747 [Mycena albidolilacea]